MAFTRRVLSALLPLFLTLVTDAKDITLPRPEDPFKDPKHDPYNPLRYIASNTLTGIAFGTSPPIAHVYDIVCSITVLNNL
jgi:hypothetical protein